MSKDWTGNGRATFTTLGASSHSDYDRSEYDYYATHPSAIDSLFDVHKFHQAIWEPACGEGHLSKQMEEYGKSVYSTDLIDRGFGDDFFDFLMCSMKWEGDIVTNPPYKYAAEFVYKALSLLDEDRQLAMFLKTTFLEGKTRRRLFDKYPPEIVYVFSRRVPVARNGDPKMFEASSAASYSWFVWRKGFTGEPIIRWL